MSAAIKNGDLNMLRKFSSFAIVILARHIKNNKLAPFLQFFLR
jgi:hypothetical protein